ncbi:MAG: efflux RND transporter periplasmic adaptor subunit [Gemmataceae bacterium]|nr:efflux RND transporter periplasmic adaptor subunit [Gemmataceae bacterium]MCI0742753.1 efflux RND transporter periplasmic adaptor subunit [Gemmataceae bacterium]
MSESANSEHEAPAGSRLSLTERVQSLRLLDRPQRGLGLGFVPWILCVVLAASTGYFAWKANDQAQANDAVGNEGDDAKQPNAAQTQPKQSTRNPGSTPVSGDLVTQSKGYIVPVRQILVSPQVGGRVIELNFKEGDHVNKDFILAKIEDKEFREDYNRTLAMANAAKHRWQELWKYREDEIRQAQADLDDTKTQRDQALQEWKRSQALRSANALAAKEYEEAESAYKSMDFRFKRLEFTLNLLRKGPRDERIAAAKAEMDQANAEMEKAKWKLDQCIVKAPITGTILSKKAEEGNQVNPAAFSNGLAASLCELADLADMEVDLAIAERDISKIFKGQVCKVKAEAFEERSYEGFVSRIMPMADRGKGAVPVRVKIMIPQEEAGMYLRPEMGAVVVFYNKKHQ